MPKISDHETYEAVLDYAKYKATARWWKILILGIMAGAFIGMGYLGAFTLQGQMSPDPMLQKFLFGAIFPVGILLCVFLGGTLFTSDSLASLPVLAGTMKARSAFKSWGLVLLGNFIGAFLMALIAVGANFYAAGKDFTDAAGVIHKASGNRAALISFAEHKFDVKWYAALASGILCNIVVAGATWMASSTKSATAKFFLLWLPITLFALAGFQHIVANFFVFWSWILDYAIHKDAYTGSWAENATTGRQVGEWFYNNLIPTTIGNWLGGAVFVPLPYFLLNRGYGKHTASDKALEIMTPIIPASYKNSKVVANASVDSSNETSVEHHSIKEKIVAAEHKVVDTIKKDAKAVKTAVVNAEHKVAAKLHKKPKSENK